MPAVEPLKKTPSPEPIKKTPSPEPKKGASPEFKLPTAVPGVVPPTLPIGSAPLEPPARLERSFSVRSQETVDTLQRIEDELGRMKIQSDEAQSILDHPPSDGLPLELRGSLAQLHGDATPVRSGWM